ncbi:MAG: hypothetical protein U1F76_07760 [Candidatus Competibacteraceae bacterium]
MISMGFLRVAASWIDHSGSGVPPLKDSSGVPPLKDSSGVPPLFISKLFPLFNR